MGPAGALTPEEWVRERSMDMSGQLKAQPGLVSAGLVWQMIWYWCLKVFYLPPSPSLKESALCSIPQGQVKGVLTGMPARGISR